SGTTAIGGSSSVTVALPIWSSAGTQTLTCTATTSDGLGGPLTWTLTATVNAAPTGVGATGGTVDLLDFVFNGDTRPPNCDQNTAYPAAAFASEVVKQAALNTQFALDLGDHMYVCTAGDTGLANAQTQFKNFTDALDANWPSNRLWFMTMGNHECQVNQGNGYCFPGGTDPNFNTWFGGLQKYSKQSFPNYKIDITTRHGLVRLLVIADNSYNATIGTWVDQQLTDADQHAFATLVARHHTVVDRTTPDWVLKLLDNHKATLLMVAHDHKYYRSTYTRANGTTIPAAVCGLGAANTGYTGFCRLTEQANGSFVITQYDIYGTPHDTWSVSGQQ
ncbi:MAG: metallophosphoesterase, partial [Deltaproteobacteria bacterium]|nr:metallophosphoesterase [Deltaproteobacteria bacterium]